MKIGMACYPTMGGSGIVATELGHELALRGHEVHFITYDIPFKLKIRDKNIFFHEVNIHQYELFKYPDYALTLAVQIAHVAKTYGLDIVHVHYAIPHATSAYLAKQLFAPKPLRILTTLHGTDITLVGKDPAYYQIVKFSIEQSDGVTAVSHSLKEQTCHYFHICEKPVEVIPNFFIPKQELIGTKPFRNALAKDDEKIIIHSSNYRPVKRAEDVVRVFIEVRKKIKCRLLLLGSGSGIEGVRSLAAEHGLKDEIIFVGKSRDTDPYIASGDLFLLPSSQESFGLAALEAMAYGLPVIATNVGGLPELIENEKTGYLTDVGDIHKMADCAIHLLANEELYASFSREAALQAANRFSPNKIIPYYIDCYERLLNH